MKKNDIYLDIDSNIAYKVNDVSNDLSLISRLDNTEEREMSVDALKKWCYIGNIQDRNYERIHQKSI